MRLYQLLTKLINYKPKPITINQNQEVFKMKALKLSNLQTFKLLDFKPLTLISKRRKAMKAKIFFAGLLFAVIFLVSSSYAEVPQMINYQGRLTDTTGAPIDTTVSMTFAIYTDSIGTDSVWSETQDPVIVEDGMFNVLLGSVTPISYSVFDGSTRYLGVKVGTDDEMSPRRPLVSGGYAFRSEWADSTEFCYIESVFYDTIHTDGDWEFSDSNIYRLEGNVGIGTNEPQYKLDVEGDVHISGLLKIGGNTLWEDGDDHRIGSTDNLRVIIDSDADQTDRVFSVSRDEPVGDPGSGIELFRVQEDGKVGIGTASPAEKLDVAGTAQMTGFKMPTDASSGYVLTSDASGVGTWQEATGDGDNDWTFRITDGADTTLITGGEWGIARSGNVLHGNADSTHVNLGVACTTGTSGQNRKYCTVGGGQLNTASDHYATVGGGVNNAASKSYATVGGGEENTSGGIAATVGGGWRNTASQDYATVGGGDDNTSSGIVATVGGGFRNTASMDYATVGGGVFNAASGVRATV